MYVDIIERWKQANPILCQGLGFHEFDTEVQNFDLFKISSRIHELKSDIKTLSHKTDFSSKIDEFEYNLIVSALEQELFELDERKAYLTSPAAYVTGWFNSFNLIQKNHTQRSFASVDERVKSITEMESKLPTLLQQAMDNLYKTQLDVASTQSSINFVSGYIGYYQDELIEFVSQISDESLIQKWSEVNESLVNSLNEFKKFLEEKLQSAKQDFALGEQKYLSLLKYTEGVSLTVDQLLDVGYADLEKNYQAMLEIASKRGQNVLDMIREIQNDYPDPEKMLDYARMTADRTKEFVMNSDLVTVPLDDQCKVIYTPESDRKFEFASMNTPGPFEVPEAKEAYYRVNPPDLSWPQERIKQYMSFFNKAFFEAVTIHEVWPGHYLQLLYGQISKSNISKIFAHSITMIEGWAHYCEEMIYEAGYEPFDRDVFHIGQLIGALIRNVRYISSVEMHCRKMTVDDSVKLFMEKAFMPEGNARIEANRGTINPMYLNYTLGKLLIKKLREDYKKERGQKYNLKTFHDELLSYGSAPISVLRNIMLENPNTGIL